MTMLDGNAIAGLLQEVFAEDMTTAIGTCGGCGAAEPLGAIYIYRGAGVVVRCPHCEQVLATFVQSERRTWVSMTGMRRLEVALE